jgi:hypothetical protein
MIHERPATDPGREFEKEKTMIRLLYFSQAVATLTSDDLKNVLASARRNNKGKDVTGVLVTGGRVFLQLLEGPPVAVLGLYLKILQDKRHADVEILRVTPITHRLFEDWSMALVEATPLEFQQIIQFKTDYLALGEPQEFKDAMRGLLNVLKGQKKDAGDPIPAL